MTETGLRHFSSLDWLVLAGYFLILIITGILFSRRQYSTEDYFLARGRIPLWAAGISFMATALSAATFIGAPQQSYKSDLTYLSSNIGSVLAILIVALFFIPAFYRLRVSTVYGLLDIRFGKPASLAASGAFMVGKVFSSGARLYIAALPASLILFGDILPRHQIVAITTITLVGIFYTLVGGIRSVIWTDVIQTVVFVGAALAAMMLLLDKIPLNIGEIHEVLRDPRVGQTSKMTFLKLGLEGFGPKHAYTFLTALFGFSLLSLGAYGTDQDMAQRLLTCKSSLKGSWSAITGILVGLPVTTLFMGIGLLLYIFYARPDLMGVAAPQYQVDESRKIFLSFILLETPMGMAGLMMAGLFAAALSSLNSAVNAMSSTFINDFYKYFIPKKVESHYLAMSRIGVIVFGIILGFFAVCSVFWQQARPGATLIDFALMVMAFAYSGLVAVYLTALFTKRGNNLSVIAALITGFLVVLVMQIFFVHTIAFPWQMFIATILALIVCLSGKIRSKLDFGDIRDQHVESDDGHTDNVLGDTGSEST